MRSRIRQLCAGVPSIPLYAPSLAPLPGGGGPPAHMTAATAIVKNKMGMDTMVPPQMTAVTCVFESPITWRALDIPFGGSVPSSGGGIDETLIGASGALLVAAGR